MVLFSFGSIRNTIKYTILAHQKNILDLAEHWRAPVLADPTSQIKFSSTSKMVVDGYDLMLRYKKINPDLIVRFGRKPTSKVLCQLLEQWEKNTLLVDEWEQFNDNCVNFIQSNIGDYCRAQIQKIDWKGNADWVNQLLSYFKYNDVRVNVLAYSLLNIFREPLPKVLKSNIMDPIGTSSSWRWFGYENSWTTIDGLQMQSVSGGGHSGGGNGPLLSAAGGSSILVRESP